MQWYSTSQNLFTASNGNFFFAEKVVAFPNWVRNASLNLPYGCVPEGNKQKSDIASIKDSFYSILCIV